jgi:Omp85 superfamily domain
MKLAWLGCVLLSSSLLPAGTQDAEFNVNTRYTVETVIVSGDGWTTNLASDQDEKISSGLKKQIAALIGTKLNPGMLDDLAGKLRKEFQARAVTHRLARGASPEYVQVLFQVKLPPTRFDVSVPKFLYHAKQGWSGAVEGTATVRQNGFTLGLVSDGDELAERYTGLVARYDNTRLGTDRVRLRFQFESYHEQWNRATQDELLPQDASGVYRTRQNFEPVVTFVIAKPLTLSVGAGFERFQDNSPAAYTEAANALITTLRYHRRLDDSEYQQDLDADYNLRAAAKFLASDFLYTRQRWSLRYAITHGRHRLSDSFLAGALAGRAPLFERYVLGNSTTLRGWNKYEIDPLGGNRMVHNSVDYRYGCFQVFYDSGAVWESGQPVIARHSLGVGLRQGPLFVAVAVPVREGRVDPIFMLGMNY